MIRIALSLLVTISCFASAQQLENNTRNSLAWLPKGQYTRVIHFDFEAASDHEYFHAYSKDISGYIDGMGLATCLKSLISSESVSWIVAEFSTVVFDKEKAKKLGSLVNGSVSFNNSTLDFYQIDSRLGVFHFKEEVSLPIGQSSFNKLEKFYGNQISQVTVDSRPYINGRVLQGRTIPLVVYLAQPEKELILVSTRLEILKKSLNIPGKRENSFVDQLFHKPFFDVLPNLGQLWIYSPGSLHNNAISKAYEKELIKRPMKVKKNYPEKTISWQYQNDTLVHIKIEYLPTETLAESRARMLNAPIYNQDLVDFQMKTGVSREEAYSVGTAVLQPFFSSIASKNDRVK